MRFLVVFCFVWIFLFAQCIKWVCINKYATKYVKKVETINEWQKYSRFRKAFRLVLLLLMLHFWFCIQSFVYVCACLFWCLWVQLSSILLGKYMCVRLLNHKSGHSPSQDVTTHIPTSISIVYVWFYFWHP